MKFDNNIYNLIDYTKKNEENKILFFNHKEQ